jgi:hypothetical protein
MSTGGHNMPPKKPETLAEALLAAQANIETIAHDGRNDFAKYNYVTAETMIAECRKVLLDAGVLLTAGDVELIPCAEDTMIVRQTHRLSAPKIGEGIDTITRDWPAVVSKGRPIDKAVAGALTAGLSYTLRDLLLIPRGDEPGVGLDDSSRPHPAPAKQKPRPQASPRKQSNTKASNSNSEAFTKGDMVAETGENPEHEAGRVGEVFWSKGDRIGSRWGDKDDVTWGFMREFVQAPAAETMPTREQPPPIEDDQIPF